MTVEADVPAPPLEFIPDQPPALLEDIVCTPNIKQTANNELQTSKPPPHPIIEVPPARPRPPRIIVYKADLSASDDDDNSSNDSDNEFDPFHKAKKVVPRKNVQVQIQLNQKRNH
jgi:hypothetical protein